MFFFRAKMRFRMTLCSLLIVLSIKHRLWINYVWYTLNFACLHQCQVKF